VDDELHVVLSIIHALLHMNLMLATSLAVEDSPIPTSSKLFLFSR